MRKYSFQKYMPFVRTGLVMLSLCSANISAKTEVKTEKSVAEKEYLLRKNAIKKTEISDTFGSNIPGLINDHIVLGTAYHSGKKKFLNIQPVDGVADTVPGELSFRIDTGIDLGYDSVLKAINGNVDVDINFPVVRVQAGAAIAKETAASNYASSYTFSATATPKTLIFKPRDIDQGFTLSPVGKVLADDYQSSLHDLAGDEFVTSIEYGAQLFINMKIEYRNEQDKSDIGGYLGVDIAGGIVSVDGKLNFIDEEVKQSVKITVRALQKGGDPMQLIRIIPNNIITCTIDNPDPCFDMFSEAIRYAKSDFQNQFDSLSDYNVVRYGTSKYANSTVDLKRLVPEYQEISFATKVRILELEESFKQSIQDEHRASELVANYFSWMPEEQRSAVENIKTAAYDNAWQYYQSALFCRDNPYGTVCLDYWQDILNTCDNSGVGCINDYDRELLDIPAENVTRWYSCENARQAATDSGVETKSASLAYRKLRWAPVFVDNNRPQEGVLEWVPCEFALTTYGDDFID